MTADSVKMPQDLQAGYMHMNRFGSPLPIHGLATPGRTSGTGYSRSKLHRIPKCNNPR